MLTQLSTVKTRLSINPVDTTNDAMLTNTIRAVSAIFDRECNRAFARSVDLAEEFNPRSSAICPACYPIESVSKFEFKTSESSGWTEQTGVEYLIRRNCVISLPVALAPYGSNTAQGRLTYTGGYVLPGTAALPGQTALPDDIEQAAVEQVAFWFQNRDKLGLLRHWPNNGTYSVLAQQDLILPVRSVLKFYRRWSE